NDGSRSKPMHLPVGTSYERAREIAASRTEKAREMNLTRPTTTTVPARPGDTIARVVQSWLPIMDQNDNRSPATKRGLKRAAERVVERFGTEAPEAVTTGKVLEWIRDLKKDLSASKVRETVNTLGVIYEDAIAEEWITCANPKANKKVREALPEVEAPD